MRGAAAAALAKVGSVATVEPLRRVLREGRAGAARARRLEHGRPHARALAMPLVALTAEETEPEVLAECYRALGASGRRRRCRRWPGGAGHGKPAPPAPGGVRVAAVEGLRMRAARLALRTLEALTKDGDKAVRAAAVKAVAAAPK